MGARTKYTPDAVKKITTAITLGACYAHASGYAGISYETFRQWLAAKPAFSASVKEAEALGAITWLAKIEKAASDGIWQAAAWKLERLYPEQYGRHLHEISGRGGEPLTTLITVVEVVRDRGDSPTD